MSCSIPEMTQVMDVVTVEHLQKVMRGVLQPLQDVDDMELLALFAALTVNVTDGMTAMAVSQAVVVC